jgi:hypothetical protein
VKVRVVISLVLLITAIGLPVAAMLSHGPPWGYRGHAAVVLEVTGAVEGTGAPGARKGPDDNLVVRPNLHLQNGDELRVARLSEARLRFPQAEVTVGDGSRVVLSAGSVKLSRGLLVLTVERGTRPFMIHLDDGTTKLAIRPGGERATVRVVADGKGTTRAWVKSGGTVEARTSAGDLLAEPGRVLVVQGGIARVEDAPTSVEAEATCSGGKLMVFAPGQTQVFAARDLTWPDVALGEKRGSAMIDLVQPPPEVTVVVRDVVGNVLELRVACGRR